MAYKGFSLLKESPPVDSPLPQRHHVHIKIYTKQGGEPNPCNSLNNSNTLNTLKTSKKRKRDTSHDFEHLKVLANQIDENISNAILQLKQRLQRMDGRVVMTDHDVKENSNVSLHYLQYSLDPKVLEMEAAQKRHQSYLDIEDEEEESDESY